MVTSLVVDATMGDRAAPELIRFSQFHGPTLRHWGLLVTGWLVQATRKIGFNLEEGACKGADVEASGATFSIVAVGAGAGVGAATSK